MDFLLRLEQSGFATWVRESGTIWSYPTVLFLHTIGMAILAGLSAGINLRILGFAPNVPLASLTRFFALMWVGFGITAASGAVLLIADATTKLVSAVFYIKMVFVLLALINLQALKAHVFRDPLPEDRPLATNAKILSITSLILWVGATTAGRLMAYIGPVGGAD